MTDPIPEIEKRHAAATPVNSYKGIGKYQHDYEFHSHAHADMATLIAEVKRLRAVLVGLGYTYNRFPVVGKEVEGGE